MLNGSQHPICSSNHPILVEVVSKDKALVQPLARLQSQMLLSDTLGGKVLV